jgi:superfamily II DNA or RNA helicase
MNINNIFTALQRQPDDTKRTKVQSGEWYFRLLFDTGGAYIEICDKSGKSVQPDYRHYGGVERDIIKSLEAIATQKEYVVNWESTDDHVYLHEHEYLTQLLLRTHRFVDEQFAPITIAEGEGQITALLNAKDALVTASIGLLHNGEIISRIAIIGERHCFANGKIYEILPIGGGAKHLSVFSGQFAVSSLENYLSLLFSYLDNVGVQYGNYRLTTGEPKQCVPAIVFEKIDADNVLSMRLQFSHPGSDPDLFNRYDIRKIAQRDERDEVITVSEVQYGDISTHVADVQASLSKYKRSLKSKPDAGFWIESDVFYIEEELAKEFIFRELPALLAAYTIYGAERLKHYKVRSVMPNLSLRLSHGIDFLEGDATLTIDGETFSLFDALNQYNKNNYLTLADGTRALINQSYIRKLERLFKKDKSKVRVSFFDLPAVEELIEEKTMGEVFERPREVFRGFNTLQKAKTALPKVNAALRPYQEYGYKWLNYLHKNKLGGCLADDMGLGKTLQAITLLSSIYPAQKKQTLIVMPKTLLFNWESELAKFNPDLTFHVHYGTTRDLEQAKKKNLILTTYAMMRNDIEEFRAMKFHCVILDESQNIKNLNSQTAKAAMLLNAEHRYALSGTPLENNLGELYSLFRFLNPAMFGSIEDFTRNYLSPIQKDNDKDALHELRLKIYPFILRRLKKDVMKDLPPKVEQELFVEMSAEQSRFYEQRRQFYYASLKEQIAETGISRSQMYIFQALNELRQIATIPESKTDGAIQSPKRELLMEYLTDAVANGHKSLVFVNFLDSIELIASDLEAQGITFLTMSGATRDRKELVQKFQNDPSINVFIMTLKTGGVGLNLTAADTIFIFDPWWNAAAEAQAIDRTHRIGQDKVVFSYRLITKGTIEEKIVQLQHKKRELFDAVIGADSASIKSLNEADIEFIFGAGGSK